jgi:hypothetical protein
MRPRLTALSLATAASLALAFLPAVDAGAGPPFSGTMTVSPASVPSGTPVTLSGDGCVGGTVAINVHPGEGLDATPDAEGDWSVSIGTSTLGIGTQTIEAACIVGEVTNSYDAVTFTVTAAPTTSSSTTSTSAAPPAAAPAQPRLTG